MRKAAGFLLVLLLATLVVITTSYGAVPGDTDSSHLVHLSEPYGPQLGVSCDVCHGTETPPVLSGPSNLTNTTVCNTCHSPDGAYDGVDDANIGARNNWDNSAPPSSNIFNVSGDFQTGKEKWCVGCHDGVPSLINSVSAPNIAGEFNSEVTVSTFLSRLPALPVMIRLLSMWWTAWQGPIRQVPITIRPVTG
jgi:cytochrome c553